MKEYLTFTDIINYELAGISEISSEMPINRFPIEEEKLESETKKIIPAKNDLKDIKTIEELEIAINNFKDCSLKKTATRTVFGTGVKNAKIMFIGDAPGAEEDKQGIPFVGANGQLLDKMLASIELSRDENCYLTNIIFWRPPGNRAASSSEISLCLPFVKKHIALVNPDLIVFLGAVSLNAVLGENYTINKARGNWFEYIIDETGEKIKSLATYHPAFLLKSPAQKKNAWNDLLTLKKEIEILKEKK